MKKAVRIFMTSLMSLIMITAFMPCMSFATEAAAVDFAADKISAAEAGAQETDIMDDVALVGQSAGESVTITAGVPATGKIKLNKSYPWLSKYPHFDFTPETDDVYTFRNYIDEETYGANVIGYLLDENGDVLIYADAMSNPDGIGFYFQKELDGGHQYTLVVTSEESMEISVVADEITDAEAAIPFMQSVVYEDGTGSEYSVYKCMLYTVEDPETGAKSIEYFTDSDDTVVVPFVSEDPTITYFDAFGDKQTIKLNEVNSVLDQYVDAVDGSEAHQQKYTFNVKFEQATSALFFANMYRSSNFADILVYDPEGFDAAFNGKTTVTVKVPKKYWKKYCTFVVFSPYQGSTAEIVNGDEDGYFIKTFKPNKKKKITLNLTLPDGSTKNCTFKFKRK